MCFMVEPLPVFVDQYLSVYRLKKKYPSIMHICTLFFSLSPHSELKKVLILTHDENNIKLSFILRILFQLPYNLNAQSITNEITGERIFIQTQPNL